MDQKSKELKMYKCRSFRQNKFCLCDQVLKTRMDITQSNAHTNAAVFNRQWEIHTVWVKLFQLTLANFLVLHKEADQSNFFEPTKSDGVSGVHQNRRAR